MKKYISTTIIAFAVLVATTAVASAQSFTLGAKAGVNIASAGLHGDDIEGRDLYRSPRFGFSGGLTGEYKFKSERISLSGELLFSMQGVKYKYPDVEGEYNDRTGDYDKIEECKVSHRFSYLNIPILFNYYFVKDLNLSFNIGIQPGFLLSENSKTKFSDGYTTETWDYAYGWEGGYYIFDLALPVGFTYGLTDKITLDARYSIGLINTFKETDDYSYEADFRSTNNTFTLSVGYKF